MCMNIIPLPAGRALKIPVELAPLTDLFLLCLKGSFMASLLSGNNVWQLGTEYFSCARTQLLGLRC